MRSPFGLFTDLDGTVSEIAPTPGEAQVLPASRCFLKLIAGKIPLVALVSGRSVEAAKRMVGLDNLVYIGSHGMERWVDGHSEYVPGLEKYPEIIGSTLGEIKPYLPREGIIIEDKKVTASIHYRLTADHRAAKEAIIDALKKAPYARELRIMQNKMTVELLPPLGINKGMAVVSLIKEFNLRSAVYLGDDITDIDAFRALHEIQDENFTGFAIAVTGNDTPDELAAEADFTLEGVNDVARFLKWLYYTLP